MLFSILCKGITHAIGISLHQIIFDNVNRENVVAVYDHKFQKSLAIYDNVYRQNPFMCKDPARGSGAGQGDRGLARGSGAGQGDRGPARGSGAGQGARVSHLDFGMFYFTQSSPNLFKPIYIYLSLK